jgi:hypothetical protein
MKMIKTRVYHLCACLSAMALAGPLQAQISLTGGTCTENFDAWFAANPNTLPAGWDVVTNNVSVATSGLGRVDNSDFSWAGTATNGNPATSATAYNAALQTDITQTGDGVSDRCLAVYATGATEPRHITATFTNNTGATITALAVSFQLQVSAVREDNISANLRYDGFRLLIDPENDDTFADTALEATITNAVFNFAAGGGNPWNANGQGWATAAMLTAADANVATVSGTITGLSIPSGATFKLRWNSHNGGGPNPTPVAGRTKTRMNIGVDDLSITPTLEAAAPGAPSGLAATVASSTQINLTWTDNSSNETGFKIQRSATTGGPWTDVTTTAADAISYIDTGRTPGTPYYYQVIATDGVNDSTASNEASATTWTGIEQWRFDYFGSISNSGDGADTFDFDNDGLPNLLEYALGTAPDSSASVAAPSVSLLPAPSSTLTLTFTPQRVQGLTYIVQASDDLATWTDTTLTGLTPGTPYTHTDSVTLTTGSKRFLRLKVTSQP